MSDVFDEGASSDMTPDPALTKEDLCPVAGKYYDKPIKDIPLGYLNWLVQQDWFGPKYPEMAEYVNGAEPADHVQLLTDDSPCPMRGKHFGTPMGDVPASYLGWAVDQEWAEEKYPEIIVYYTKNQALISEQEEEEASAWAEARRRTED